MAGYPPPPYAGAPFGYDPKSQRRYAREQMRMRAQAQKAAIRAQRDLYRQQVRSLRRSSILGPLVIVGAGVVLLLLRSGRLSYDGFAAWYGNWWPTLLVAAGLVLLGEWALDRQSDMNGTPYMRRGVGGGTVFLLLLVALGGVLATGFRDGRDVWMRGFSINPENVNEFFGDKHEMTQTVDQAFPAGTSLMLDDPHGDVTIVGQSDDGKLHMTVNKQVWTRSDDAANSKSDELSPRVSLDGTILNVTVPSVQSGVADVSITMPATGAVTVNANRGKVAVSDMKSPVTVTANHGDVQVNSVAAAVTAHINHGDSSFSAHDVTGDVSVRGHAQDLNVAGVKGQVSLEGEFFGDTHLERLDGPVTFRTSRTQFSLARLPGEVNISPNSELTGNQIVGPTRLKTSSRNIEFDRISGDVDVANSRGRVDVTSAAPLGNVTIENRDGAIDLTVPPQAGLTLDAETRGGSIENDMGFSSSSQNDHTSMRGRVGDGAARIMLRTNHFDIDVKRGSVEAPVAPLTPAAPEVPKTPGKTGRRADTKAAEKI